MYRQIKVVTLTFRLKRAFYRVLFNKLEAFTALRFTATGALPAAKRMRLLPTTQHADDIWNEGKSLPLSTDHRGF
jgi:hypothetical protein